MRDYHDHIEIDPTPVLYVAYFDGTDIIRKFKLTWFEGCIPLYREAR